MRMMVSIKHLCLQIIMKPALFFQGGEFVILFSQGGDRTDPMGGKYTANPGTPYSQGLSLSIQNQTQSRVKL
jgi:hypothetical protein